MASESTQTPGWIWLLSGLVIGLFIAFLIYVKNQNEALLQSKANGTAVHAAVSEKPDDQQSKPTKFEFYKLLPKGDVTLPQTSNDDNSAQSTNQPSAVNNNPTTTTKRTSEPGSYMLQVGSFKRFEDADTLKAKLAFSGIVADIATVTLANGQEWHRVRIGPSRDLPYINTIQAQLEENDFNAMLMKVSN